MPRDVDEANLRALAAVAFASLGSGAALRYVGIALFVLLAFAWARFVLAGRAAGRTVPAPVPGSGTGV